MKSKKLIRILGTALAVVSLAMINPIAANAEWKSDSKGWWNSKGDSWSVGWEKIDKAWYYFDADGYMAKGWREIDGKWYHFENSGAMEIGLVNADSTQYYCDVTGAMQTGWIEYNDEWHYYDENGAAKTGWLLDNSKWYYIKDGLMLKNQVVEGYKLNADGVWTGDTESEEARQAKELIYKNDSEFIEKIKQYDFELGDIEETTIKDFIGEDYDIPDEKCFKVTASVVSNGQKIETIYLVGKESGKIYGSAKLPNYSMYEFKDNKIVKVFVYQKDEANSVDWHFSGSDPVEDCMYLNRKFVNYNGKYVSITSDDIKSKKSINVDDALQLALKADGKSFYSYVFRSGVSLEIKKGETIDIKDLAKGKWDLPKGEYYSFDVVDKTYPENEYTAYYYLVNKETKAVYLVANQDNLVAYEYEDNAKVKTYPWIKDDNSKEWRR